MDIDKLKGAWNRYASSLNEKEHKEQELSEILRARSQKSLKKLRRNFFIEAGTNILLVPVIVFLVLQSDFVKPPFGLIFSIVIGLLIVIFLFYLYKSYQKIYQYEDRGYQLKEKLSIQVNRLEKFIRDYYIFMYVAYTFGLFVGIFMTLAENQIHALIDIGFGVLFGGVILFLVVRPLAKRYIKKLYGSHLESLKTCLSELEDNNTENFNHYDPSN
jgi:hypothetical protein